MTLTLWIIGLLAAMWLIYHFWKKISEFMKITANQGDELVAKLNEVEQSIKDHLK